MIEEAIYTLLSADAGIDLFVSDRIYFELNTDDSNRDFLVYTAIEGTRPLNIALDEGQKSSAIQFDCYSKDSVKAQQCAEAVIALFHGKRHTSQGHIIQVGLLTSERPSLEEDTGLRRVSLDFNFYYH